MSDQTTPTQQVAALNARLQHARYEYYVESNPSMSDEEYNVLERKLKAIIAVHPTLEPLATVLRSVGSDIAGVGKLVPHSQPMTSLDNCFTEEELNQWLATVPAHATFDLEPKIDGLSLCLRYKQGYLWLGLTRGDGTAGEDVTNAAFRIPDVPHLIDTKWIPEDVEVRGEVFLTQQQFDRINQELIAAGKEPYKTSRNLASGTLKCKDPDLVAKRRLSFQPWQVIGIPTPQKPLPETAQQWNENGGMVVPEGLEPAAALEWWAHWTKTRQSQVIRCYRREDLPTVIEDAWRVHASVWREIIGDCDGIVLKVHEDSIRKEMGFGTSTPRWAIALKKQSQVGITKLVGIDWTEGRTGVLTPTALVEPVVLGGATIQRANLCNITHITKLNLHIGAKVELLRSGDVIPQILGVVEDAPDGTPVTAPTVCPICGGPVHLETSDPSKENPEGVTSAYCDNYYCPGRLVSHLTYVGARSCLDIDGLGDVLAEQLVKGGLVYSLGSLWEWVEIAGQGLDQHGEDAFRDACNGEGYPGAQCISLIKGCRKAKTAGWDSWLMALGIPGLAKELSKSVAAHLALKPDDLPRLHERLLEIAPKQVEGLGVERLKEIGKWAMNPQTIEDLQTLYACGVRPECTVVIKEGPQPLAGEVILVTGDLGPDRDRLRKMLEDLGAVTKTSVSSKLTLILAGEGAGGSKLQKAEQLKIRVEGREWLVRVFESAGLTLESRGMDNIPDIDNGFDAL